MGNSQVDDELLRLLLGDGRLIQEDDRSSYPENQASGEEEKGLQLGAGMQIQEDDTTIHSEGLLRRPENDWKRSHSKNLASRLKKTDSRTNALRHFTDVSSRCLELLVL